MLLIVKDFFPLMITKLTDTVTEDDVKGIEEASAWTKAQKKPHCHIYLCSEVKPPDSAMRKRLGELQNVNSDAEIVANAVILNSAVLVGVLRAIRWIAPAQHNERSFATARDAVPWLVENATKKGLVLPQAGLSRAIELDARPPKTK